ncbi:unnamed protein product [Periconia digitata]|uniref:Uncharacterized protein n=1 Tax=Periconia digitata TaxID=1303443 RepID=A0A9W4XVD2_9PLEO|nr:unnamed protein product [Periconia digitata]
MDAHTKQTPLQEKPGRFCFRFKPQDIPGEPGARSITVADAFMQQNYERKFDWEKDYVYTPAGIDDEEINRKLFMFLDVNKNAGHACHSPRCYRVEGSPMTFTETKFNGASHYSLMFPWGGRDRTPLE